MLCGQAGQKTCMVAVITLIKLVCQALLLFSQRLLIESHIIFYIYPKKTERSQQYRRHQRIPAQTQQSATQNLHRKSEVAFESEAALLDIHKTLITQQKGGGESVITLALFLVCLMFL